MSFLPLLALSGILLPTAPSPEEVIETFADVCVENTQWRAQYTAAAALPEMTRRTQPDYDNKTRQKQLPRSEFFGSRMQVGLVGYSDDATCYVSARVNPTVDAAQISAAATTRFGQKLERVSSRANFYRGSLNLQSRTVAVEWKRDGDRPIFLLSIRKRDGFSK